MRSIIFALLASFMWGTAPVLFKLGLRGEVHPISALVFHNLSAFLLALVITVITGMKLNYPLREVMLIIAGGIMSGFLGLFFFFEAVKRGEVLETNH